MQRGICRRGDAQTGKRRSAAGIANHQHIAGASGNGQRIGAARARIHGRTKRNITRGTTAGYQPIGADQRRRCNVNVATQTLGAVAVERPADRQQIAIQMDLICTACGQQDIAGIAAVPVAGCSHGAATTGGDCSDIDVAAAAGQ